MLFHPVINAKLFFNLRGVNISVAALHGSLMIIDFETSHFVTALKHCAKLDNDCTVYFAASCYTVQECDATVAAACSSAGYKRFI